MEDILFQSSLLLYFNKSEEALNILNSKIKEINPPKEYFLKRLETYIFMKKSDDFLIQDAKKIVKNIKRWLMNVKL